MKNTRKFEPLYSSCPKADFGISASRLRNVWFCRVDLSKCTLRWTPSSTENDISNNKKIIHPWNYLNLRINYSKERIANHDGKIEVVRSRDAKGTCLPLGIRDLRDPVQNERSEEDCAYARRRNHTLHHHNQAEFEPLKQHNEITRGTPSLRDLLH